MGKLSLSVGIFIIASLVLVSCVTREVPVTETYYETEYKTEYKTETYTTTEDVVVMTIEGHSLLSPNTTWRTTWVYLEAGQGVATCYYGYDISKHEYVPSSRKEAYSVGNWTGGSDPAPKLVQKPLEYTRSQVQISVYVQPQIHKGYIVAIDLSDACYDENLKFAGILFGKEPNIPTVQPWIPAEGCQLISPQAMRDARVWANDYNALARNPARILGKLSVDKTTTDDQITFNAKGVKEFAIVVNVEPEVRPPHVKLTWSDDVTEKRTITKERQVPYQVPVQVEKQRTVMKTQKVPVWEAILGK